MHAYTWHRTHVEVTSHTTYGSQFFPTIWVWGIKFTSSGLEAPATKPPNNYDIQKRRKTKQRKPFSCLGYDYPPFIRKVNCSFLVTKEINSYPGQLTWPPPQASLPVWEKDPPTSSRGWELKPKSSYLHCSFLGPGQSPVEQNPQDTSSTTKILALLWQRWTLSTPQPCHLLLSNDLSAWGVCLPSLLVSMVALIQQRKCCPGICTHEVSPECELNGYL